jgi:uncharacterized membrane protein
MAMTPLPWRVGDGGSEVPEVAPAPVAASQIEKRCPAMPRFEDSIELDAPLESVYDQWTQFESFPQFMQGVESVVQEDDRTLHWTAKIAGQRREWTARITDQTPNTRIAWKSISGAENAGAVLFAPLPENRTRITLKVDVDPQGPIETIGANAGLLEGEVEGDLRRFKDFIEQRRVPTGAWRGEIHGDEVVRD